MNTVSHTHTIPSDKQIKQSAKAIQSALKELHNFNINHTQALEISSRSYGFKNWNIASASAKKNDNSTKEGPNHIPAHQQHVSALENMSQMNRDIVMAAIKDCAMSIRLSHLDAIESVKNNTNIIDKMLESAILLTYDRSADDAHFGDLVEAIRDTTVPPSIQSTKAEILYVLSSKDPKMAINYYGIVVKSAKDGAQTREEPVIDLSSATTIKRLHLMEAHFKKIGHPLLETACKAIVGSNKNGTALRMSVNEESMKETEGVWRAVWVPHKIAILLNEEIFKQVADQFGFDATDFINKLRTEISGIETFLSSNKLSEKESQKESAQPINRIQSIFAEIQGIPQASQGMHTYINSLSKEDYALLSTVFDLGRKGWERNYYETSEYESFVENLASNGYKVTQKMADERFLPKSKKKEEFDLTYKHMFNSAIKYDGDYNHNWLSGKINLIRATREGIDMLNELM